MIHVKLDIDHWYLLALAHVVSGHLGHRIRNELQNKVEIDVLFELLHNKNKLISYSKLDRLSCPYIFMRVKVVFEFDNIAVIQRDHDA